MEIREKTYTKSDMDTPESLNDGKNKKLESFDLDQPVGIQTSGSFIKKEELKDNKQLYKILDVQPSPFKKFRAFMESVNHPGEPPEGWIDLPGAIINVLVKKFGNTPKQWLDQKVVLWSEDFHKVQRDGSELKGLQLRIEE